MIVQPTENPERVAEVIPTLRLMAGNRLVTLQDVEAVPPSQPGTWADDVFPRRLSCVRRPGPRS